jgi:hypothetical protein
MLTAVAWLLVSMAASVVGAYVAIFTVRTRDNLNAWVATGFACAALVALTLIIVVTMKPT